MTFALEDNKKVEIGTVLAPICAFTTIRSVDFAGKINNGTTSVTLTITD